MFMSITIVLALIALAGGIALLIWAKNNKGKNADLAKIFGYIISITAIVVIIITFLMIGFGSMKMGGMMKGDHPMGHMMHNMQ